MTSVQAIVQRGESVTLDEVDSRLIQQLQRDGRTSYQTLGRAVGLTRTAARARVQHLFDRQVIRVVTLPDTVVAGRPVVAHVCAEVTGSALAAAHAIAALNSATFVSVTVGEYPVTAELRTGDDHDLATDLDQLRALPGIHTINVIRTTALVRDAYRPRRTGRLPALDATDRTLIAALERDGRISYAQLSAQAGLSPAATRARVLRLTRTGAVHITVLTADSHTARLARAGVGLNVAGPALAVAEKAASLPDITYVTTGTGRYDIIAAADAASETSLLPSLDRLRRLPGITRQHSWRHLQIVKESYAQISQPDTQLS